MKLQDILQEFKNKIDVFFENETTKIFKINIYNEFESTILQVLLEKDDDSQISFDELVKWNEKISNVLDSDFANIEDDYMLEVSSAGAEKEVTSIESLKNSIDKYFFVQTDELEFNGTLTSVEGEIVSFKYFIKGQPKKVSLDFSSINFIRYAIKF